MSGQIGGLGKQEVCGDFAQTFSLVIFGYLSFHASRYLCSVIGWLGSIHAFIATQTMQMYRGLRIYAKHFLWGFLLRFVARIRGW